MGLVQSMIFRPFSTTPLEDEVPMPSNEDIFDMVRTGNANRLSELFENYDVNLTMIDGNGNTLLHVAALRGRNSILSMLLNQAGGDPNVLDAKNREGFTPLMAAAAKSNATTMKVLVDAGAGVDNQLEPFNQLPYLSDKKTCWAAKCADAGRTLIAVQGNISAAFDMAVQSKLRVAASIFFLPEVDSLSTLERCIRLNKWDSVEMMLDQRLTRPNEVFATINEAVQAGNQKAINTLVNWDHREEANDLLARYALTNNVNGVTALLNTSSHFGASLVTIAKMADHTDAEKIAAIKMIANATSNDFTRTLIRQYNDQVDQQANEQFREQAAYVVRILVAAGIPAAAPLKALADKGDQATLSNLIANGGYPSAMALLREQDDPHGKWQAPVAYEVLKVIILEEKPIQSELNVSQLRKCLERVAHIAEAAPKAILNGKKFSEELKIAKMKRIMSWSEDIKRGAEALMRDEGKVGHYDRVKLLMAAQSPGIDLLMNLGRTNSRGPASKVIDMGADIASAINHLISNSKIYAARGDHDAARREQNAANQLVLTLGIQGARWAEQTGYQSSASCVIS